MYSRSFMFLGVILFIILSTQVLAANHVPEPSISEPMASMKNRLMFSKSDSMTVSESLMAKESSSERIQRHIESFEEMMDKSDKQDDEENKVFFDVEEAKLQKSVEEDGVSKHDDEDKVSLSDEIL
ncbi:hypothetical protein P8452_20024 [Trifolium repens]|nr:hypothetical protein P8452_20024 [Trifolium repens]